MFTSMIIKNFTCKSQKSFQISYYKMNIQISPIPKAFLPNDFANSKYYKNVMLLK